MRFRIIVACAVLVLAGVFAAACGSATSPTTVSGVAVTGSSPAIGASVQLTATATMGDGSTQDVTSLATWSSSNVAAATVSSAGLVTGVAAGTSTVTAAYGGQAGSLSITPQ